MAASTQRFKMHSALLSSLFSIALLSPTLKCHYDYACRGLPLVFAEAAARNIDARDMIRSGSHFGNNSTRTCHASGKIDINCDDRFRNNDTQSFDESGQDHYRASCTSSSVSLCLRPLTASSLLYLRTLYRHHDWEEENGFYDCNEKQFRHGYFEFCWQSFQEIEPKKKVESMVASSKSILNTALASRPSTVRLSSNSKNDKMMGRQSLALKVDLLFATLKFRNNDITLPQSIAELLRNEKASPYSITPEEDAIGLHDERFSSTASTQSRLPITIEVSSRAASRVDLTGRWRPANTISAQDLTDYDEFLKACCSDKISYWTRQLLSSSSVVSRQEFVVKQFDEGRILEFVDVHPLASNVWNRTIVTSTSPKNNRLGKNSSAMARQGDSKLDGRRSYANRIKGPQGNPVLVEAYWEENGTVHTSLLRMAVNDDNGEVDSDNQGWLQTRRYLYPGTSHFETRQHKEDKTRVMVVETTYHLTLYRTETETMLKAGRGGDTPSTKMVWKWEQVAESTG